MENLGEHGRILGALGASKGGFARAEALSSKQLSKIATHAINTRWSKRASMPTLNSLKRASITK